MDSLDLNSGGVTEANHLEHHNSEEYIRVVVLSSVLPVCAFIVLVIVLRRIIMRRRNRVRNARRNTIYTISDPVLQLQGNDLKSVPDIERVVGKKPVPKSTLGEKFKKNADQKVHKTKETKCKKRNYCAEPITFPREPVYRTQKCPSYLVPFTDLPKNFDFSLPNVEVHSDFVFIKDLDILQTYWYETENTKEEYKQQPQVNPNFT